MSSLGLATAAPNPPPTRVVIVDRQDLFRRGLVMVFAPEQDITIVGDCGDLAAAVVMVHDLEPDVALVDAQLPEGGAVACAQIRRAAPDVVVLMLTADPGDAVLDAVAAGAAGRLPKETSIEEVAIAVRSAVGLGTAGRRSDRDPW